MSKRFLTTIAILPAIALLAATAGGAESFTLTEDGQPRARIVVGGQPPETVAFAARELRDFVREMSGAELPIAASAEPGTPSILLGPAAREQLGDAALEGIERDGYVIQVAGGNLCVVGIDDTGQHTDVEALLARGVTHDVAAWNFHRGTLYGVYRLLEELGMRWFLPGEFGQRAPQRENLRFRGRIHENPHFITRTVGYWSLWVGVNFRNDWQAVTIMPGERDAIGFSPAENRLWELRMRGESFRIPLNHNPTRTQWFQRFGQQHPEYFALLPDGRRDQGNDAHLCYTHPGVAAETIGDVNAFAAGQDAHQRGIMTQFPHNRNWNFDIALDHYYSVLPNDGFRQCTCNECRALVPETRERNQQHSRLVWDFVARVARETPEVNVCNLAYGSYSSPYPGMQKLPPNVVVGFCAYTAPARLYYGDSFQQFEHLLQRWAELTDGRMAFWQHYLSSNRGEETAGMPEHVPEMYARAIRTMARFGNHAFCEMPADSIMFNLFNRYLLLKLFYDPSQDEQELFEDFVANFYGPDAGPVIARVYADIGQKTIERFANNYAAFSVWERLFSDQTMRGYHEQIDGALAEAAGTSYEAAVSAFKHYYLGLMDRGRMRYADPLAQLLASFNPELVSRRVDAELDDAARQSAWRAAEPVALGNTVNGRATAHRTEVRSCHDADYLYFRVNANLPGAADRPVRSGAPGEVEGIAIYLDAPRNYRGYFRIAVDLTGAVHDYRYFDDVILADPDWRSRASAQVELAENAYVVEVAVPRKSLGIAAEEASRVEWGVLVGRTQAEPPQPQDRRSSTSIILRGELEQPGFFNTLKLTE
jgi:hypothetical protein